MSGFLGIGGSSAKTDRGNQLAATQGEWNIFSQGLEGSKAGEKTGQGDLDTAKSTLGKATDYWSKLLTAGRADTAERSAPAINATLEGATATRNAEGTFGTDRTGGTVAANREAGSKTQSKIDDIINTTLNTGKEQGAQGLKGAAGLQAQIGSTELSHALSMLGLSSESVNAILSNSTQSRPISNQMNLQTQEQWGQLIGGLLLAAGV